MQHRHAPIRTVGLFLAGALALTTAALAGSPPAAGVASGSAHPCRVADLGTLPGHLRSQIFGGSSAGLYAGSSSNDEELRAVVWRPGAAGPEPMDVPAPSLAFEVNEAGMVAGYAAIDLERFIGRPFVWHRGTVTYLPDLGKGGGASSVNEDGDVAGSVVTPDGKETGAVWHRGRTGWRLQVLDQPPAVLGSYGIDVSEHGQLVGLAYTDFTGDAPTTAYRWTAAGRARALPVPAGATGGSAIWVSGDGRRIAGAVLRGDRSAPAVWRRGATAHVLPAFAAGDGQARTGDDRSGWYGGDSSFGPADEVRHPWAYRSGDAAPRLLVGLSGDPAGDGFVEYLAPGGRKAAGRSARADGNWHATVWTCGVRQGVPAPARGPAAGAGTAGTSADGAARLPRVPAGARLG